MSRSIGPWIRGRFPCLLGMAVVISVTVGCETQERVPITGEVRFDGQPVTVGQIAFYPIARRTAIPVATGIQDGEFSLSGSDGLRSGRYRVQITAMRERQRDPSGSALAGPLVNLPEQYIPVKYNDETVLEVEVQPERRNYFEFELEAH